MNKLKKECLEDYFYIAEEIAKKEFISGMDFEDLLQEGYLSIIEDYSKYCGTQNMHLYLWKNAHYRMKRYCQKFSTSQKIEKNPLNLELTYFPDFNSRIDLENFVNCIDFKEKERDKLIFWRLFYGADYKEATEDILPEFTIQRRRQIVQRVITKVRQHFLQEKKE